MPEPIIERLSRFTPDGSGLDRDALLFAAGRASIRPNRAWMAIAGALAASQVLTLAFLWPKPATPAALPGVPPSTPQVAEVPPPRNASELGVLNRRLLETTESDLPPMAPTDDLV